MIKSLVHSSRPSCSCLVANCLLAICLTDSVRADDEAAQRRQPATSPASSASTLPTHSCAWIEQDGIRAAWLSYKQVDDEMVEHLVEARVNTVIMKHGFHDLLRMETARREGDRIVVDVNKLRLPRVIENTRRAADRGLHVFWLANYELDQMLPHLQRLGYQTALAEGPGRYLPKGPHADAAPLDPVFWRGITGAHGEMIARLSRAHPIAGVLYDTEHYGGGMMYLQNSGFSDATFQTYLKSRNLEMSSGDVPPGTRYDFLKSSGRLLDYSHYLEEQAFRQGRDLARRWHAINPHLVFGVWPLLDNWFSQGLLRGLGGAVPSLGLSGVEYYHGSDQSESMAEFFGQRNPNMLYVAGFYPPFAYSVEDLRRHVGQTIRETKHYWMLGPGEELPQPQYQAALRAAFQASNPVESSDTEPIDLRYRIEQAADGPLLVVETDLQSPRESMRLSLHATFGGAALCERLAMTRTRSGSYLARVRLRRRITNNRFLPDGFRSGATYRFSPVPREFRYEDPHHTKLIDGRAYGYFGTTVAWSKTRNQANVTFDLHRPYRIVRVEIAQPNKLEDRIGGPTALEVNLARDQDTWGQPQPLEAVFRVQGKNYSEPDTQRNTPYDPRHGRAWLSWKADFPSSEARWIRLDLRRIRANSSISLGEVVITALFTGEIQAQVFADGKLARIDQGSRWTVP